MVLNQDDFTSPAQGHLATSRDVFRFCNQGGGTADISWAEARMLLTSYRVQHSDHEKEYLVQNVSNAQDERLWGSRLSLPGCQIIRLHMTRVNIQSKMFVGKRNHGAESVLHLQNRFGDFYGA